MQISFALLPFSEIRTTCLIFYFQTPPVDHKTIIANSICSPPFLFLVPLNIQQTRAASSSYCVQITTCIKFDFWTRHWLICYFLLFQQFVYTLVSFEKNYSYCSIIVHFQFEKQLVYHFKKKISGSNIKRSQQTKAFFFYQSGAPIAPWNKSSSMTTKNCYCVISKL